MAGEKEPCIGSNQPGSGRRLKERVHALSAIPVRSAEGVVPQLLRLTAHLSTPAWHRGGGNPATGTATKSPSRPNAEAAPVVRSKTTRGWKLTARDSNSGASRLPSICCTTTTMSSAQSAVLQPLVTPATATAPAIVAHPPPKRWRRCPPR